MNAVVIDQDSGHLDVSLLRILLILVLNERVL